MILYVVEIYNYCGINEWQTVDIWKSREGAEKAMNQYIQNHNHPMIDPEDMPSYRIVEIDTNIDSDCIYDVVSENGDE